MMMRVAVSALTCIAFLFALSDVGWSENKKPAPGTKYVYKDVDGKVEVEITVGKRALWNVDYTIKDRDGRATTRTGKYGSTSGRLQGDKINGQWNEKTQTLEVTVKLPEGSRSFALYRNGLKPKVEAKPAPDDGRWIGNWGQGAYRYSLTVPGGMLDGLYRAEFNDNDPRHSDFGAIKSTGRDGEFFIGTWEGQYSDGEKKGPRSGTFKLKLQPGATAAEDLIVGEMVEVGKAMQEANPGTSMYPGRKYPVSMKRVP